MERFEILDIFPVNVSEIVEKEKKRELRKKNEGEAIDKFLKSGKNYVCSERGCLNRACRKIDDRYICFYCYYAKKADMLMDLVTNGMLSHSTYAKMTSIVEWDKEWQKENQHNIDIILDRMENSGNP